MDAPVPSVTGLLLTNDMVLLQAMDLDGDGVVDEEAPQTL